MIKKALFWSMQSWLTGYICTQLIISDAQKITGVELVILNRKNHAIEVLAIVIIFKIFYILKKVHS